MRTFGALALVVGVIYLAFAFAAPGILPDFDLDPFLLGGGALLVGIVLVAIDENARNRRKWKMGPLGK